MSYLLTIIVSESWEVSIISVCFRKQVYNLDIIKEKCDWVKKKYVKNLCVFSFWCSSARIGQVTCQLLTASFWGEPSFSKPPQKQSSMFIQWVLPCCQPMIPSQQPLAKTTGPAASQCACTPTGCERPGCGSPTQTGKMVNTLVNQSLLGKIIWLCMQLEIWGSRSQRMPRGKAESGEAGRKKLNREK